MEEQSEKKKFYRGKIISQINVKVCKFSYLRTKKSYYMYIQMFQIYVITYVYETTRVDICRK